MPTTGEEVELVAVIAVAVRGRYENDGEQRRDGEHGQAREVRQRPLGRLPIVAAGRPRSGDVAFIHRNPSFRARVPLEASRTEPPRPAEPRNARPGTPTGDEQSEERRGGKECRS